MTTKYTQKTIDVVNGRDVEIVGVLDALRRRS